MTMHTDGDAEEGERRGRRRSPALRKPGGADALAWLVLAAALVFVLATFGDYGTTVDEWVNDAYGRLMLDFWRSRGADGRAFAYHDLRYYGPWYQTLVAALQPLSPLPPFATRHLAGGLLAWLTLVLAWRIGRQALGAAGGLLALVLLAATGYFVGNAFNNPIDLPFAFAAALYLLALGRYAAARLDRGAAGAPAVGGGAAAAVAVGVALGLVVATRVGGGLLALPLLLLQLALLIAGGGAGGAARLKRLLADGVLIAAIAAATLYALAPWLWADPAGRLSEALRRFASMPVDIVFPMFGLSLRSTDLPAWYLPAAIAVRLPLAFLAGLILAPLLPALPAARRPGGEAGAAGRLALLNCAAVALVPIAAAILAGTTLYDGFRHFLFVLVPLAVLAAAGMMALAAALGRRRKRAPAVLAVLVAADLILTLAELARLHPYQYVWYNRLAGGPAAAAAGRFEGDYWFASVDEAVRLLVARFTAEEGAAMAARPVRVGLCILGHDIHGLVPEGWILLTRPQPEQVDFMIQFERNLCPEVDAAPAYVTVARLGIPFAVVRDLRSPPR